jgi:hypothetical protein
MAGILSPYSDSTCSHHNALRNITVGDYACGVSFRYKSSSGPNPFDPPYGVVSLQECCDMVNATLMRIPDNTGCEMQFCVVPSTDSTRTFDYIDMVSTTLPNGQETVTRLPPVASTETIGGPPSQVTNCMAFVGEYDLPSGIKEDIRDADYWCVVRMYDTDLSEDEVRKPVTAPAAPAAWTEAAKDPWELKHSATNSNLPQKTGGNDQSKASKKGIGSWAAMLGAVALTISVMF